jgi:hypothetical protein
MRAFCRRAGYATRYLLLVSIIAFTGADTAKPAFGAEPVADPVVTRRMQAFYEVYAGRKLTASETRALGEEFWAGHRRSGKSRDAIVAITGEFALHMILLREENGRAAALSLRHRLLEANYFRPEMQNTLELRLLTEPDPIRVVDARSGRLMTEQDIVALANLRHFTQSKGDPLHRALSRAQIDKLVGLLNQSLGTSGAGLPQFFGDAAAFWAGVRQLWRFSSNEQKKLARTYARDTWRVPLPVELYAAFWGLDRASASSRWSADVARRIRGGDDTLRGMDRLRAVMDAMFAH